MATASVPRSGRASEAGTLVPGRSTTGHKVTPVPIPKPGSAPSLPLSASNASAAAGASSSSAATASGAPAASQPGFGLLNPVEANLQDAAHRDGRIRNPVPSKLKGKTDGSKGNFSVLHMDVAGRSEATERDAQAKRTSESTELAAKRAYENGYVSLRRSRFVHVPDETVETPPPKPFVPSVPAQTGSTAGATSTAGYPAEPLLARRSPLNSEETKAEQARLLTLLRSLHPILVVDQICKALAFFGGIPGAPPPADGSFPESAEANGPGSLFVGWIAEIFPKLGGNTSHISHTGQPARSPARQLDSTETIKRRRGRPKGSKATKARKDKGIKKGPTKPSGSSDQVQAALAVDESWVDVDDGDDDDDDDDGARPADNVEANVMLLAQTSAPQPSARKEVQQRAQAVDRTPVRTALPVSSGDGDKANDGNSRIKRRGRPKGSKNRPKDAALVSSDVSGTTSQVLHDVPAVHPSYVSSAQGSQPPPSSHTPVANSSFTAVNSSLAATTPVKKKNGRPKGSTGKQKSGKALGAGNSASLVDDGLDLSTGADAYASIPATASPVLEPNSRVTQGQTYHTTQPGQPKPVAPVTVTQAQQTAGNPAQKRKRKSTKEANTRLPSANSEARPQAPSTGHANGVGLSIGALGTQSPQTVVSSALTLPPAKRARKTQEPKVSNKKQVDPLPDKSARHQTSDMANVPSPVPGPKPSPVPAARPPSAQNTASTPVPTPGLSTVHITNPISVEPPMPSISSPHHSHFEVQSPTIENYEAQLQAQLEQQAEAESQPLAAQPQVNSRHLMANRLHHQQHQQNLQQRQQQMQHAQQAQQVQQVQQVQQQVQQPSVSHTRSPNPQPQLQPPAKKSQTESPVIGQQQTRQHSQSQQYSQYRAASAQYSQQQHQPDQHEHRQQQQQQHQQQQQQNQHQHQQVQQQQQQPQQPQQTYSSPQASAQHFAAHQQNAPSVTGSSQQYSTSTQQNSQYGSSQPSYTPAQYAGGQQHLASQQRYQQQLGTSSVGTSSYTSHQSPQFGTSTANSAGFNTPDSNYRATTSSLSNSSYVPQRTQSATPSATAGYRPTGVHTLSHHSSSFGTGAGQHRSTSATHPVSQSVQGMPNVGSFSTNTAADWGLFDTANLEAAGNQGALGLSNTSYNMNTGSVRAQQSTGTSFSTNSLANFDTSGLGGSDRYYGVQRR